ncbi:hypothetical protein SLEP1_g58586 [Rubroshorea leprosula]|uniref:Uncharacterized protein n=1 Tax=Rubroshorea leprosula TaxID=152421 RepID=A0AAV5MQY3_9ROSI|nr:hypothetical protein SLEP1_g58586 [Rubroshorea leprosula]
MKSSPKLIHKLKIAKMDGSKVLLTSYGIGSRYKTREEPAQSTAAGRYGTACATSTFPSGSSSGTSRWVFQNHRLYRCLDKARILRRSQLNEEQDLSEPERLHPMSLSSLKPKESVVIVP